MTDTVGASGPGNDGVVEHAGVSPVVAPKGTGESRRSSRFRQSALHRYESPERLDRPARVADSKAWIGLGAAGLLLAASLAWGIWGGIPNQITMSTELVREGAFSANVSGVGGTVTQIFVAPGDSVTAGDPILTVSSDAVERDILAGASGTVQGISVVEGDETRPGEPVATVVDETSHGVLSAVTYVGPDDAVELRSLPVVSVAPAVVDAASFGRLEGVVAFVADVPASPTQMAATLQSTALADSLLQSTGGVAYLVRIAFDEPLRWTNDDAPPFDIVDGTAAEAIATLSVERPIDLLFGR